MTYTNQAVKGTDALSACGCAADAKNVSVYYRVVYCTVNFYFNNADCSFIVLFF